MKKTYGSVDLVVNNAGIQHIDEIVNLSFQNWRKVREGEERGERKRGERGEKEGERGGGERKRGREREERGRRK